MVQVFFFSNLQQYITNIQISKTIPIPAIYILQCSCSKDRVLRYAGFNDLKVCKLCVNQHRLKHRIKPLIAYNIPEQFISYTFVHLAVLLGWINWFLNGNIQAPRAFHFHWLIILFVLTSLNKLPLCTSNTDWILPVLFSCPGKCGSMLSLPWLMHPLNLSNQ